MVINNSQLLSNQKVAILIDGNNIERSIHAMTATKKSMLNIDEFIPRILNNRALVSLFYFREGEIISNRLKERLHKNFGGTVVPCYKSADIPLTIKAMQLATRVDVLIIVSGDGDFIELIKHLKSTALRVEIAAVQSSLSKNLLESGDFFHSIKRSDCFTMATVKV